MDEIIEFWFEEIKPEQRWKKDPDFDKMITDRFGDVHKSVARCETFDWRRIPEGRLAEIIVLDQFSRNIYRDQPGAFAYDCLALALSQEAIVAAADHSMDPIKKSFLYMPFMHSESPLIHEEAVKLFTSVDNKGSLDFELKHKAIIDRFGRYPHRNKILGRESTPDEVEFLKQPGSGF